MDIFKKKVKKYFIFFVGSYIGIRIFTRALLLIFPDLLPFENPDSSITSYSDDYLIFLIGYIVNILFIINIKNDLKYYGIKSVPILIVTFFSSYVGVILCLIVLFKADLYKGKILYE